MAKDAMAMLCEGTLLAALTIIEQRDIKGVDFDKLAATMAHTISTDQKEIMREWEDALNAHMSEAWIQKIMTTQCISEAIKTLKAMGLLT